MPPPVLIVDDDDEICEAVRDLLESEGYPVIEAEHGQEALARLEDVRPGVILLDLMMPVMSGWEFHDAIKVTTHSEIPIIVASAVESDGLDVARTIRKPFTGDQLLDAIRAVIAGRRA